VEELCYPEQARVQADHWWYVGRRRLLRDLLNGAAAPHPDQRRALDLGCGVGANVAIAHEHCSHVVGVDDSRLALRHARSGVDGGNNSWVCANATALPFADRQFDLVLALDLFEHVDDDGAAAAEAFRVLRPGGLLCAFVPALRALWGLQDRVSHHRRRYSRRELRRLVEGAAFSIERLTFFNSALLPPIALARWAMRVHTPAALRTENEVGGPLFNTICRTVFGLETRLLRHVDLPLGVSLACLARRR
jgi:SAM-dependent methyltransferase